jgi:hypothetical protein
MKCRPKLPKSSSARTICGHRPWRSSVVRRRWQTQRIIVLEERLSFQEEALLAALRLMGFKFITFRESAQISLH